MNNVEFFEQIANQAEAVRQEVRARNIPGDASIGVEMLCYCLREVHNKALMVAERVSEIPEKSVNGHAPSLGCADVPSAASTVAGKTGAAAARRYACNNTLCQLAGAHVAGCEPPQTAKAHGD